MRAGSRGYMRADVVMAHYYGPGRHLFLDCAITDPATGAALAASPSSADASGVAATLRAERKNAKYGKLAAAVSSQFKAAVVERFGTFCDEFVGLLNMLCGDKERDAFRDGDYTFSASSRTTYAAGLLGLSVVIADAAMVERVVSVDVCDAAKERYEGGPARNRGGAWAMPGAREIEGMGGRFLNEAV